MPTGIFLIAMAGVLWFVAWLRGAVPLWSR